MRNAIVRLDAGANCGGDVAGRGRGPDDGRAAHSDDRRSRRADSAPRHDGRTASVQDRHRPDPRPRAVASDGGGPIRRAQVRISGSEVAPKAALTDAEGRFEFRDLPAGRFTLQATKSGLRQRPVRPDAAVRVGKADRARRQAEPRQRRHQHAARQRHLADASSTNSAIRFPDVAVTAMRQTLAERPPPARARRPAASRRPTISVSSASMACRRATTTSARRCAAAVEMHGHGVDDVGAGATASAVRALGAEVRLRARPTIRARRTSARRSASRSPPARNPRAPTSRSCRSGSRASPASSSAPMASRSRARRSRAVPRNREFSGLLGAAERARAPRTAASRSTACAPGDYTLQARSIQVFTSTPGRQRHDVPRRRRWRRRRLGIRVRRRSRSGARTSTELVMTTSKGGTATGRVTFDGAEAARRSTSMRITSMPVDQRWTGRLAAARRATKEDGIVRAEGADRHAADSRRNAPPGWTLKSVKLNGTDITDTGAEFKAGETDVGPRGRADQQVHIGQRRRHGQRRYGRSRTTRRHLLGSPTTGGCR